MIVITSIVYTAITLAANKIQCNATQHEQREKSFFYKWWILQHTIWFITEKWLLQCKCTIYSYKPKHISIIMSCQHPGEMMSEKEPNKNLLYIAGISYTFCLCYYFLCVLYMLAYVWCNDHVNSCLHIDFFSECRPHIHQLIHCTQNVGTFVEQTSDFSCVDKSLSR